MINSCRGFCSFRGLSYGGVLLALQASDVIHLGAENPIVARQVGRLLDGVRSSCLAELVHDGDLIMLVGRILEQRERDTVRVTKVRGMLMRKRFGYGRYESWTGWETMRLMRLVTLGAVGYGCSS